MNGTDFIPTRGSSNKRKAENNFEVLTYESYKSKGKKKKEYVIEEVVTNKNDNSNINIKRAKYEIIKFGMSGFSTEKKEEAKVQLAIKLGAKPRKNKYQNYKKLLEDKKKIKETENSQIGFQQLGKNSVGRSTAKGKGFDRKRKKEKTDFLDVYGKVKPSQIKDNFQKKKR